MEKSFAQEFVKVLRDTLDVFVSGLADPAVASALMHDAGFDVNRQPAFTFDRGLLAKLDDFIEPPSGEAPGFEDYAKAMEDAARIRDAVDGFLNTFPLRTDAGKSLAEARDFMLQVVALNFVRDRFPWLYHGAAIAAIIVEKVEGGVAGARLRTDNVDHLTRFGSKAYYQQVLPDFSDQDLGDWVLGGAGLLLYGAWRFFRIVQCPIDFRMLYGWDSFGIKSGLLPVENVLERTLSLAIGKRPAPSGPPPDEPPSEPPFPLDAILADFVFARADESGGERGLFAAFRIGLAFEEEIKDGPTGKVRGKVKIRTTDTPNLDVFISGSGIKLLSEKKPRLGVAIEYEPLGELPSRVLVGAEKRNRFQVSRFPALAELGVFTEGSNADADYKVQVRMKDAGLFLVPGDGDGLVDKLLRILAPGGELKIPIDLTVGVSKGRGFFIEGGTGLKITRNVGKQIGPLRVDSIVLGIEAKQEPGEGGRFKLSTEFGAGLTFKAHGITIVVDQVGVEWQFRPESSLGFKPPKGVGISIDLPPVAGGGYLFYDKANDFYAGAFYLGFGEKLAVHGVGVVQSIRKADGTKAYSFVVILGLRFTPIQIGFGFTLNAVGGLFGQNRGVSVEVLQDGIRTGALEKLLFPENPVENAPRIISVLSSAYPPTEGQTIFGPAIELGWGGLIDAQLGLVIEFEEPHRIVLLGRVLTALPKGIKDPVLRLEVAFLGTFNPTTGDSSFDATLYNSYVGPYTITGDLFWRQFGGTNPIWILVIGGVHPKFKPDERIRLRPLQKVGINLVDGDNPRARLEGYSAITSNTLQVGGAIDVSYSKAGFTLAGHLGIDALINTADFTFEFSFGVSLSLRRGSTTIAHLSFEGTVTGPRPFHIDGRASIGFLFFSVSFHVSFSIGPDAPKPLPGVSALDRLLEALADPRNWSGQLPELSATLVSLRQATFTTAEAVEREPPLLVHPLGQLTVRERVAPLNLELQRLGSARITGDRKFTISQQANIGSETVAVAPVRDLFPLGEFLDLKDDDRLSRPSFELLQSGAQLGAAGQRAGDTEEADLGYKTIFRRKTRPTQQGARYIPSLETFLVAVQQGAAAQSPLRRSGRGRFQGTPLDLDLKPPLYTVVDIRTLAFPTDNQGRPVPQPATTYFEALQAVGERLVAGQSLPGTLQVVAIHEVRE